MVREFKLHHHIARPLSLYAHKPIAQIIYTVGAVISAIFVLILSWLLYLVYTTIEGAPFILVFSTIIVPLAAAVTLFFFFLHWRKTFNKELSALKKFRPKMEHSFRHK